MFLKSTLKASVKVELILDNVTIERPNQITNKPILLKKIIFSKSFLNTMLFPENVQIMQNNNVRIMQKTDNLDTVMGGFYVCFLLF